MTFSYSSPFGSTNSGRLGVILKASHTISMHQGDHTIVVAFGPPIKDIQTLKDMCKPLSLSWTLKRFIKDYLRAPLE